MILGSHIIISAYGFWLPNDPRGSWSDFVAAWDLYRFGGKATKVQTTRSVASRPHDRRFAADLKHQLKYPPVVFNGEQARAIARGFAAACTKSGITVYGCAVLPDHAHLMVGRHKFEAEQVVNLMKGEATKSLRREGLDPFPEGVKHSPWSESLWKVFLDSEEDIVRSVRYVRNNPPKEGKKEQRWNFVTPYPGA